MSAFSLPVTLANAIAFLTAPLVMRYSSTTIMKLRSALDANLTSAYATNWFPDQPLRGSGRRCLSLSPNGAPPRPIYNACLAANVSWPDWFRLLGGFEFDLFIDPGCISIRNGLAQLVTIWSDELEAQAQLEADKSLNQLLREEDEQDDQILFNLIADEVRAPTWMTPVLEKFPSVPPAHTRSSSRSSTVSSSGFSFSSDDTVDSFGSFTSISSDGSCAPSPQSSPAPKRASRRERARQARVFVDNSKTEVTPYDGGKTTVLTGGVMLGAPQGNSNARKNRRF